MSAEEVPVLIDDDGNWHIEIKDCYNTSVIGLCYRTSIESEWR